jgi:two-component system, OmpR family, KDP operon response regulator KdpE
MPRTRILILERDSALRDKLLLDLKAEGWESSFTSTLTSAIELVRASPPDLVILDSSFIGSDNFHTCRNITCNFSIPLIILSSSIDSEQKIKYLEMGVEECLIKQTQKEELIVRIKSILRRYTLTRYAGSPDPGFKVDVASRKIIAQGKAVKLTRTEYLLLMELFSNQGRVISYRELLNRVWGSGFGIEKEYVHVYVNYLRKKIEPDPQNPRYIINQPGFGYMYQPGLEKQEVDSE